MSHTDTIADLLTRIRNASRAGHPSVEVPISTLGARVVEILVAEGYVAKCEPIDGVHRRLRIWLKYSTNRQPVLSNASRISKPGCRVFVGYKELTPIRNGLGIAILSTPKGVMTDAVAREQRLGGEVLCHIW